MNHKKLIIIGILMIMATFSLTLNAQSWNYFKTATVGTLQNTGTNYQIKLTVHFGNGTDSSGDVFLNSHSRTDFGDVRFFEGSTELSYWMESYTASSSAVFWVKLNGDLSNSNIALTIKYGNANATTTSSGVNTFIFFDDFSGDLSKWTIHKALNNGTISIPSGENYVRCGNGRPTTPFGHTVLGSSPSYNGFQNNAIEYRFRLSVQSISEVGFRGRFVPNAGTGYKVRSDTRPVPTLYAGQSMLNTPYYGWEQLADAKEDNEVIPVDTWHRGTATAYGNKLKFYRDGILKRSSTLGTLIQTGEISLQNHYGAYSDYDWVAVRKFADAEPTISNWGEETLPVELSSFTVALNTHHNAVLTWVTQSETGVMGFYIYRATDAVLANAQQISSLIDATNTSDLKVYVYTDKSLSEIGTYYYWLMAADMDGSEAFHGPIFVNYEANQPGTPDIPRLTGLKEIYPNPFNPKTNIGYELAKPSDVLITIFNMRGQEVRSFERSNVAAGSWNQIWDGKDQNGTGLASGVYYIRLQAGQDSFFKKAVLMK